MMRFWPDRWRRRALTLHVTVGALRRIAGGRWPVLAFGFLLWGCTGGDPQPSPQPSPSCSSDADCGTNGFCEGNACVAAADAAERHIVFGYFEQNMFVAVPPGGDTRLYIGFQGASHIFAGLLLVGPPPSGGVRLAWMVRDATDEGVLAMSEAPLSLTPTDEPNTARSQNQLVQFGGPASQYDGRDVEITIQVVDFATREVLAEHTQVVRLAV